MLPDARTKADISCWHCCEKLDGDDHFPIPRAYDVCENAFHVVGATCGPSCAKAYLLEHSTFDRGHSLSLLHRMMYDVYGSSDQVIPTPPRAALKRFGGPFSPQCNKAACLIVEPPFISYHMLAEEHLPECREVQPDTMDVSVEDADSLSEPPPPGMFADYVAKRAQTAAETTEPKPSKTKSKSKGSLERFIKQP